MADRLVVICVEGNDMIALSARSDIELARVPVRSETTISHVTAAKKLMDLVFANLEAQGYPRAASGRATQVKRKYPWETL